MLTLVGGFGFAMGAVCTDHAMFVNIIRREIASEAPQSALARPRSPTLDTG
jgi:hypothetical protein